MPNIEIKQLFKHKRFPDNEFKILVLIAYLPVGLLLFLLRTVIGLGLLIIGCAPWDTPVIHKLINKIACLSLGISVTVQNPEKKENVDVYVSNNLSVFDHLVVNSVTGAVTSGPEMHSVLSHGLGMHHFGNLTNIETFKRNIKQYLVEQKKSPIYFTPEDKITNGTAILKFKTLPFSLTNKIQPICISIERPLLDISITTLGSPMWIDVFCYMFSPITNYKLQFLPVLEKKSLSDEEFSEIVRQNIATALKVEPVDISAADVAEWEKRQLVEQRRTQNVQRTPIVIDSDVRRMASQVKEVLPHVPLNAIFKDLTKTRNVDNTITNILEGRVYFIPEPTPSPSTSSSALLSNQPSTSNVKFSSSSSATPSTSTNDRDLFNTAATTFGKSVNERTKSFQERKEILIANARKRYIEKHNLNIT